MAVRSQIARERIVNYIAGNGFNSGDKLPPEKTMAEICDVSIITVRRALSDLEKNNVVERIHGRGTFVKINLQSTPQLGQVLFISIGPTHESKNSNLYSKVEEEVAKRGYRTDYIKVGSIPDTYLLENLENCKGIILYGWVNRQWVDFVAALGIPSIAVSTDTFDDRISTVTYDYYGMMKMLVEHMVRHGCRRIGSLISANSSYPQDRLAATAFHDSLTANNISVEPTWQISNKFEYGSHFKDLKNYFNAQPSRLDGIILYGTAVYVNLLNFLIENPQFSPLKIGIILFSDRYQLANADLKLTTIVLPTLTISECLVNLLFNGDKEHVRISGKYLNEAQKNEGE